MKIIIALIIIIFTNTQNLYSQEKNTEIEYEGGEAYFIYQDAVTLKTINKVPFGKVRAIYYDTFYKSYTILLSTPEGATGFTLKYVRENKLLNEIIMVDSQNNYLWGVIDRIEELGKLMVIRKEPKDGIFQTIYFENISSN